MGDLVSMFPPKVPVPDGTYVSSNQHGFVLMKEGKPVEVGVLPCPGDFAAFIEGREVTVSDEIVDEYRRGEWF